MRTPPRGATPRLTPTLVSALLPLLLAACSSPEVSPGSNVDRGPGQPGAPGNGGGSPGGGTPGGGSPGASGGGQTPTISLPDAGGAAPAPAAPTQCAAEVHKAEVVPLDLLILMDASGSMTGLAGMRSKWVTAQTALRSFISDSKSAGLGVGLQFFPQDKTCTTDRDCVATATTDGSYCKPQSICSSPAGPAPDAPSCSRGGSIIIGPIGPIGGGSQCPMGTSCMPAGVCAGSGLNCSNLNQACPGGGGTCMPVAKSCSFTSSVAECDQGLYEKLAVPIGTLPMAAPALTRSIMFKGPTGGTPMGPAVSGSLKVLRDHLAANPGRKAVLVLASDGVPSPCSGGDVPTLENNIRMAYMGTPSIPTYVIGVFTQLERDQMRGPMTLDTLAAAGGSMRANVITANEDLTQKLQEAFNEIRGAALACEYKIPEQRTGAVDFRKVNLRYTTGGTPENLPYVERADRCDPMRGGWHYDIPPGQGTPTKILVCPSTCQRFKTDKNAQVDLVFGCVTETIQ